MEKPEEVITKFGAQPLTEELRAKVGHRFMYDIFFAHRDFDKALKEGFVIVSGRGPSRRMHIGHLALFSFVRFLQEKFNVRVFIPFSDDEKLLTRRGLSYEEVLKMDYENLLDILAIGFDLEKTEIMIDLINLKQEVYNLAVRAARLLTTSTVKAAYGFTDETNIGAMFYPAMQIAHILWPTVATGKRALVVIGADQDVFVKLARDVAEKLDLKKPAALLGSFLPGLTGEKMSSSKPETAIYTTDSYEEVKRKIWNAFTGGRETAALQRQFGGNPEVCVVEKWLRVLFGIDVRRRCRSGKILCGECKKLLLEKMWKMLEEHQKKREKVKPIAEKIIKRVPRS